MSTLGGRLERLEQRLRPYEPLAAEPSARDQLRTRLAEMAQRSGPIHTDERPDSEEVLAKVNARVEVLTRGGGGR